MKNLCIRFLNDEAGFIVSAELILVSTITVLALVVGLNEVAFGINQELNDVGAAFGSVNQSFHFQGAGSCKGRSTGSCFSDQVDNCDSQFDIMPNGPHSEQSGWEN